MRNTALLFLGLMMATGCPAPKYPQCKKDKHCEKDGERCVDGMCQQCSTDAECTDGLVCQEYQCVEPTEPEDSGTTPCTSTADCEGGLVCRDGTCTGCESDDECDNGACNPDTMRCPAEGVCTNDDECPMDEICDGGTCIFPIPSDGSGPCGLDAVYFGFDSDKITPAVADELAALAKCIQEQGRPVTLEAHADNVGTEEYNILLTDRRGQSVMRYLVTMGVTEGMLTVIGKGALEATGDSESGRAKDRRVDIIFAE